MGSVSQLALRRKTVHGCFRQISGPPGAVYVRFLKPRPFAGSLETTEKSKGFGRRQAYESLTSTTRGEARTGLWVKGLWCGLGWLKQAYRPGRDGRNSIEVRWPLCSKRR